MELNKKNIGIIFPVSRKMGIFQLALSTAEGLINYCNDFNYTILYFGEESPETYIKIKNSQNVTFIALDASKNNLWGKIKTIINLLIGKPIFIINKKNKEILRKYNIDLLIPPSPLLLAFDNNIPYIVPIPDVMYKYYPGFPEYSFKDNIISDIVFRYSAKYARLCITDSASGKNDVMKFFHQPEDKIRAIPYIPPGYVFENKDMTRNQANDILLKYTLPDKFIFYPAQFWFHKNHLRLVKSIAIIKQRYQEEVNLVLVGDPNANKENYEKVMDLARSSGIENQIFSLGYVTDEEIVALYKKSIALVFASVGGPTNIPIVEAMLLGTPVVCPNLFAMPDQVQDAGVLFDPFNPEDMAEKIKEVWENENLRKQMIEKGYRRAKYFTHENYAKMWIEAVRKSLNKI